VFGCFVNIFDVCFCFGKPTIHVVVSMIANGVPFGNGSVIYISMLHHIVSYAKKSSSGVVFF
jgi:hypothetical protein